MRSPGNVGGKGARRGEVYLFDVTRQGGRIRKVRPVLIVQNDMGNAYSPETIVATIRNTRPGKRLPVRIPVTRGTGGVEKESDIDLGHLTTVPQGQLGRRIGAMPPDVMKAVDDGLRISLGL